MEPLTPREEGYEDVADGYCTLNDNPYVYGTEDYREWEAGAYEAFGEIE